MRLYELISLFKIGKASARSHMRNLIEIAAADGNLGQEEQRLLDYAAQRNGISSSALHEIRTKTSAVKFEVPRSEDERFFQLYDLVHMMNVDKNIHPDELRLCEVFAIKFGFRKEVVRELIEVIRQCIEDWIGPKEAKEKVARQFQMFE